MLYATKTLVVEVVYNISHYLSNVIKDGVVLPIFVFKNFQYS